MNGKINAARRPDVGGYGCLAGTASGARQAAYGYSRSPGTRQTVRIPPLVASAENSEADRWPLQSFLELGALPGAVPCARLHTRQVMWEWCLTEVSDSTELVVSELVTNAVQASRATGQPEPVRLWLLSDTAQVLILVWDASPLLPAPAEVSDDAESGRGLLLVETLSEQWASHSPPGEAGKYVWARIGNAGR